MNKMNTNPNLPANAVRVSDVRPGMRIRFAFDGTGVHTVERVVRMGTRVVLTTDKGIRRCNTAGTVRSV